MEALRYLHNKAVVHKNLRVSQSYISSEKTLPLDILRSYTIEILEALKYLHNKAVVHKNLIEVRVIYLKRKTLPLDILRFYTIEILEALKCLHNKAVVHKNLRVSQSYISYEENSPTRHS